MDLVVFLKNRARKLRGRPEAEVQAEREAGLRPLEDTPRQGRAWLRVDVVPGTETDEPEEE
jgi:hypothetical protein